MSAICEASLVNSGSSVRSLFEMGVDVEKAERDADIQNVFDGLDSLAVDFPIKASRLVGRQSKKSSSSTKKFFSKGGKSKTKEKAEKDTHFFERWVHLIQLAGSTRLRWVEMFHRRLSVAKNVISSRSGECYRSLAEHFNRIVLKGKSSPDRMVSRMTTDLISYLTTHEVDMDNSIVGHIPSFEAMQLFDITPGDLSPEALTARLRNWTQLINRDQSRDAVAQLRSFQQLLTTVHNHAPGDLVVVRIPEEASKKLCTRTVWNSLGYGLSPDSCSVQMPLGGDALFLYGRFVRKFANISVVHLHPLELLPVEVSSEWVNPISKVLEARLQSGPALARRVLVEDCNLVLRRRLHNDSIRLLTSHVRKSIADAPLLSLLEKILPVWNLDDYSAEIQEYSQRRVQSNRLMSLSPPSMAAPTVHLVDTDGTENTDISLDAADMPFRLSTSQSVSTGLSKGAQLRAMSKSYHSAAIPGLGGKRTLQTRSSKEFTMDANGAATGKGNTMRLSRLQSRFGKMVAQKKFENNSVSMKHYLGVVAMEKALIDALTNDPLLEALEITVRGVVDQYNTIRTQFEAEADDSFLASLTSDLHTDSIPTDDGSDTSESLVSLEASPRVPLSSRSGDERDPLEENLAVTTTGSGRSSRSNSRSLIDDVQSGDSGKRSKRAGIMQRLDLSSCGRSESYNLLDTSSTASPHLGGVVEYFMSDRSFLQVLDEPFAPLSNDEDSLLKEFHSVDAFRIMANRAITVMRSLRKSMENKLRPFVSGEKALTVQLGLEGLVRERCGQLLLDLGCNATVLADVSEMYSLILQRQARRSPSKFGTAPSLLKSGKADAVLGRNSIMSMAALQITSLLDNVPATELLLYQEHLKSVDLLLGRVTDPSYSILPTVIVSGITELEDDPLLLLANAFSRFHRMLISEVYKRVDSFMADSFSVLMALVPEIAELPTVPDTVPPPSVGLNEYSNQRRILLIPKSKQILKDIENAREKNGDFLGIGEDVITALGIGKSSSSTASSSAVQHRVKGIARSMLRFERLKAREAKQVREFERAKQRKFSRSARTKRTAEDGAAESKPKTMKRRELKTVHAQVVTMLEETRAQLTTVIEQCTQRRSNSGEEGCLSKYKSKEEIEMEEIVKNSFKQAVLEHSFGLYGLPERSSDCEIEWLASFIQDPDEQLRDAAIVQLSEWYVPMCRCACACSFRAVIVRCS
eukprot:TRINITY_DN325_c0_g2_i2.p1 TRINITY_DN325_c0_g2~~TRINITY_DN325_c0_g2_i2.p1  ORF type:complete len:1203 (-),score=236.46 TRINITY_DN325_c0_g2_i2:2415-6023(-)